MKYAYMGGRLLDVDLSSGRIVVHSIPAALLQKYVGGRGLGARLLYDNLPPGTDPYDPENLLLFVTGPLVGSGAPLSTRFIVVTKSPLTGGIADAAAGGTFGVKLKSAGYDVLLVRGQAASPVYLAIGEEKVSIEDAGPLWGLGTQATQERLPAGHGMAVIGPAGENLVRYAAIVSGERIAGRGGVGAVMGSKRLKAVIANGKKKPELADPDAFKRCRKQYVELFAAHPVNGDLLPRLGTANIVMSAAASSVLPTRNFRAGSDPQAFEISGEKMAERDLIANEGCLGCTVRCGRLVSLDGSKEKASGKKGPEYETLALLGSNLGNFDLQKVYAANLACDDLGLDTISAGNTIGFAMELTQQGLLQSDLAFDRADNLVATLHDIAHRRGLGNELAEGVKRLADRYGGQRFAMHVKGLELPGYDPRGAWGQGLEYATANRGGDHVQGATMYLEAIGHLKVDPVTTCSKHHLVIMQQNTAAAIGSLVMCLFTSYPIIPAALHKLRPGSIAYDLAARAFLVAGPLLSSPPPPVGLLWYERLMTHVTGRRFTFRDFFLLGERTFTIERLFNLREGLGPADDALPARMLEEPIARGLPRGVPLAEMLPRYYRTRGWDARGRPETKKLAQLGIDLERHPFEAQAGEPLAAA